ncbi:MAG TPA: sigma-70 family RNA polymerase sigma factor [Xanthomonadaceae bacterium]|nr:sigma-70 family RNA polymerase sigma factor [Xanthomonadaceae bacterium]
MSEAQPEQSTASLIARVQDGQESAREDLFRRCLPLLRRFARGRLPQHRRDLAETDDLVQVTLLRALNNLGSFESRGQGAFFAYLRQIMLNAIREEIRRHGSRPHHTADLDTIPAAADSVVAHAVGEQTLEAYERGLAQLGERQREAVVLRVEFDMSYPEIALELDCPSADAARMLVARGLQRLAELMP